MHEVEKGEVSPDLGDRDLEPWTLVWARLRHLVGVVLMVILD